MTLEAGFGAAAAIMEMLLQSDGQRIRVFPALPDRWHDAFFADLRAEGAFLVTASCRAGKVGFVRITAEAGGRCRVRNPFAGPAALVPLEAKTDRPSSAVIHLAGELLEFDTQTGTTYQLTASGPPATSLPIEHPAWDRTARDRHFFGLKRLPRF